MDTCGRIQIASILTTCVILIFLLGYYLGSDMVTRENAESLDGYFSVLYQTVIKPHGEDEINGILQEVEGIDNDSEKLNAIAAWVTSNFTEYYWEKYWQNDVNWSSIGYLDERYLFDKSGDIRAVAGAYKENNYLNDPYWIAHYRIGACGELAHLFEFVANKSGYETRIVAMEFEGNNHAWVELVTDDDEWMYFDPTLYGEYHNEIIKIPFWFGKREKYPFFGGQATRIYDVKTKEDMSEYYPHLMYSQSDEKEKAPLFKLRTLSKQFDELQIYYLNLKRSLLHQDGENYCGHSITL